MSFLHQNRWKALVLACAAIIGLALGAAVYRSATRRPSAEAVHRFDREDIRRILLNRSVDVGFVWQVRRTRKATGFLVTGEQGGAWHCAELSLATSNVSVWPTPGKVVFGGGGGVFYAWLDERGDELCFSLTQSVALPRLSLVDVDPGGAYFTVGEQPTRAWVGRTDDPDRRQIVAEDMLADRIFANGHRILLSGWSFRTNRLTGGVTRECCCLFLKEEQGGFRLISRRAMAPWGAAVVDSDLNLERVLVQGVGDWSPRLFLYDTRTDEKVQVGRAKDFNFIRIKWETPVIEE